MNTLVSISFGIIFTFFFGGVTLCLLRYRSVKKRDVRDKDELLLSQIYLANRALYIRAMEKLDKQPIINRWFNLDPNATVYQGGLFETLCMRNIFLHPVMEDFGKPFYANGSIVELGSLKIAIVITNDIEVAKKLLAVSAMRIDQEYEEIEGIGYEGLKGVGDITIDKMTRVITEIALYRMAALDETVLFDVIVGGNDQNDSVLPDDGMDIEDFEEGGFCG